MKVPDDLRELQTLHLEMGMQCNVRCAMCFQTDFRPSSRLPEIIWKEKLLPAYNAARELVIIGGEPTVLPNCRELLQMVLEKFPPLRLTTATNGIRFSGLWEDAFLRQGAHLNFSLNAVTPALYARLTRYAIFPPP